MGVNDAPAMAKATAGIAIGGAGLDVALMAGNLGHLPFAVALSRATSRVILQNLWLSLAVIALLVPQPCWDSAVMALTTCRPRGWFVNPSLTELPVFCAGDRSKSRHAPLRTFARRYETINVFRVERFGPRRNSRAEAQQPPRG